MILFVQMLLEIAFVETQQLQFRADIRLEGFDIADWDFAVRAAAEKEFHYLTPIIRTVTGKQSRMLAAPVVMKGES